MRLLEIKEPGEFSLTGPFLSNVPAYAILSHTWAENNEEEVTFEDFGDGSWRSKPGYGKIQFCGEQAARDGLRYIWVDTCCIKKSSDAELTEALNSMFRWYQQAAKCYAYLTDVVVGNDEQRTWDPTFRRSRWFTRGWTLQEMIAPPSVHFFSGDGKRLGDKALLGQQIHEVTGIPVAALQKAPLSNFTVRERLSWAERRTTKRGEDMAYCMLGIVDVYVPLIYGEGKERALVRLREEAAKRSENESISPTEKKRLFLKLMASAEALDEQGVRDAINEGANVNTQDLSGSNREEWQKSIAHVPIAQLTAKAWEDANRKKYATALQAAVGAKQTVFAPWQEPQPEALRKSRLEVVQLLLQHGADVNAGCPEHGDALHIAVFYFDKELANLLLDHGADINVKRPVTHSTALQEASYDILSQDTSMIQLLLDRGAEINAISGVFGSALAVAASSGPNGEKNVQFLLEHGAWANLHGGPEARVVTPLHAAVRFPMHIPGDSARYGVEPVVKMLVEAGAQIGDLPKRWQSHARKIVDPSSCSVQ